MANYQQRLPARRFAKDCAWNQSAQAVPLHDHNADSVAATIGILRAAGIRGMSINYDQFAFPIYVIDGTQMCNVEICNYDNKPAPLTTIPWFRRWGRQFARGVSLPGANQLVRPSLGDGKVSDGALILYNPVTGEEFDFWQVTTTAPNGRDWGHICKAGSIAWFQVVGERSDGCQLPVCDSWAPGSLPRDSCRASGVPYLAGLLAAEDFSEQSLISGIPHALAFTLPRLRHIQNAGPQDPPDYVYPASRTEYDKCISNQFALAAGMRVRLKEQLVDEEGVPVDLSKSVPVTRLFFCALRNYGAYLADGAGAFGFAAEDQITANLNLPVACLAWLVGANSRQVEALLASGCKQWQILMQKLRNQLDYELSAGGKPIPFAAAPDQANFDVIANATIPCEINSVRQRGCMT